MFRYLAVSRLMQEFTNRIFRHAESARAELDGFQLAIPDPAVHGFGVDASPLRHFGYGDRFRAFHVPGMGCVACVIISFSPAGSWGRIKKPALNLLRLSAGNNCGQYRRYSILRAVEQAPTLSAEHITFSATSPAATLGERLMSKC